MTHSSPLFFSTAGANVGADRLGGCLVREAYNARKGKNGFVVYGPNLATLGWFPTLKAAEKAAGKVAR